MIDLTTVSREFRGLVSRRQELFTFLGSIGAALRVLLQTTLAGRRPQRPIRRLLQGQVTTLLFIDAGVFLGALVVEQVALVIAGWRYGRV